MEFGRIMEITKLLKFKIVEIIEIMEIAKLLRLWKPQDSVQKRRKSKNQQKGSNLAKPGWCKWGSTDMEFMVMEFMVMVRGGSRPGGTGWRVHFPPMLFYFFYDLCGFPPGPQVV